MTALEALQPTSASGRMHEYNMMPESGRTGGALVQPQGAG